jgi:Prokaryotic cytochrome b561
MGRRASPKTDFGTVILHWTLVALFVVCVVTGLRIATVSPFDFGWIYALDSILPSTMVWTAHVPVAVALFGLAFAYAVYIRRAGLMRRIRPDRVRLMGIFRGGQACWVAFNTMLTWLILLTMLEQLVTGYLIYLGYGGMAVELHRDGTWLLIAISVGHVASVRSPASSGRAGFRRSRRPSIRSTFSWRRMSQRALRRSRAPARSTCNVTDTATRATSRAQSKGARRSATSRCSRTHLLRR